MTIFDKKLLFVGQSIIKGKDRIKKNYRSEGKKKEVGSFSIQAGIERPFFGPLVAWSNGSILSGLFGP